MKHATLSTVITASILVSTSALATKFPLTYHPGYGSYTIDLKVGKQPSAIPALVDTGSANLNFITKKTRCVSCAQNYNFLNIKQSGVKAHFIGSYYDLRYGSGDGLLHMYYGKVAFGPKYFLDMPFSVFVAGQDVSSIMGLAYRTVAAPVLYPLNTIMDYLSKKYEISGFALRLCRNDSKSYIDFGLTNIASDIGPERVQYTPIVSRKYYVVLLNGVYGSVGSKKQLIHQFGPAPMLKTAIVDSGTTGRLYFPTPVYKQITKFVQTHTPQKYTKDLPKQFWTQSVCIPKSAIELSKFPTLYFALQDAADAKKSIYVALYPTNYISNGGCGIGSLHFTFAPLPQKAYSLESKFHKNIIFKDKIPQLKILGTPFFENDVVIFDRNRPPYYPGSRNFGRVGIAPNTCAQLSQHDIKELKRNAFKDTKH